jgi:hypothetical protein
VWFLELGTHEGFFGHGFLKATFNLACRGDSTGQVHTKHLRWNGDSVGVPFAHSKDSQVGADATKRLPRHIYANPLEQSCDFYSAIFGYLAAHPEVLAKPDGPLFPGTIDAQTQRFRDVLKVVLLKHEYEIENQFGFKITQIGVHLWRKAAYTKLNCGSISGPTSVAACIRGGYSIGSTRDVYVAQEKASDEYCGKILSGLPEHDARFSVSYPDVSVTARRLSCLFGASASYLFCSTSVTVYSNCFGEERNRWCVGRIIRRQEGRCGPAG